MRIALFFTLVVTLFAFETNAQKLSGKIVDESGAAVPFATVYVREIKLGTASNDNGQYEVKVQPGVYSIVYQSIGYETVEKKVAVGEGGTSSNVTMKMKPYEIASVCITNKTEDPAYGIMRRAIGMAPFYQNQVASFKAEVYLKGSMKVKKLAWIVRKMADKEDLPKIGAVYLSESLNNVTYTAPDKYKQQVKYLRSNFPGSDGDDSPMQFVNASFYSPKVGEIILPLAPYAFNHYKFKYEGYKMEGDVMVNKIKVIPRRQSKQLVAGYIYVADKFWNLHGLDLTVEMLFGTIRVQQNFGEVENNIWLPISHNFNIAGKFMGNEGDVKYTASVKYKEVEENKKIKPPSSFPEVRMAMAEPQVVKPQAVKKQKSAAKAEKRQAKVRELMEKESLTNREMYQLSQLMAQEAKSADTAKKSLEIKNDFNDIKVDSLARKADSTVWQQIRPVALTEEEIQGMAIVPPSNATADSAKAKVKRDTVTRISSVFNDVIFGKTWRKKANRFEFSGIITPTELRFNTVDGFVAGAYVSYQRFISSGYFEVKPSVAYAFNRKVAMGVVDARLSYSPMRRGLLLLSGGSTSTDFNRESGVSVFGNSVASLCFRENYMKLYEHRFVEAKNRIDITNGLVFSTDVAYYDRRELQNTTDFALINKRSYTTNIPFNGIAPELVRSHKAAVVEAGLSYTPEYFYRMWGNRKMMVGSKYPTFWAKVKMAGPSNRDDFSQFVHLEGGLFQTIKSGAGNEFTYSLSYGDFLSKKNLYFADYKHFNTQEIPVVVGDFSSSYQLLGYYSHSAGSAWASGFVKYESPFLFLKYLPVLSNRMWKEDLYGSWLYTKGRTPYFEAGYGLTQISLFGGVGVFVGFEGQKFSQVGLKACFSFRNEINL